jgi:hypothetical protein
MKSTLLDSPRSSAARADIDVIARWLLAEAFASSPLFGDEPEPPLLRDIYNSIAGLGGAF